LGSGLGCTGNFTAKGFHRDAQLGTGSTISFSAASTGASLRGDNAWQYFGQIRWLEPIATQSAFNADAAATLKYRPGSGFDRSIGIVNNNGCHIAGFDKIAPVLQIIVSHRQPDSGSGAFPNDTGYDRLLIAPGVAFTKVIDDANSDTLNSTATSKYPFINWFRLRFSR
jgi:hypothetical protein